MYFERKTAKCPICGDEAQITTWKPPKGIEPRFREYRCTKHTCRSVFYMPGIYHTDGQKPSDENRGLLSVIE